MRLSEQATTPVRPAEFWGVVAAVVVLLGGVGLHEMQTGHTPGVGHWFFGGALLLVWLLALSPTLRYGRQAMPWQRALHLAGYTLFSVGHLWPHPPPVMSWAADGGLLIVVVGGLLPFLEFGRPRGDTSGGGHSSSAV